MIGSSAHVDTGSSPDHAVMASHNLIFWRRMKNHEVRDDRFCKFPEERSWMKSKSRNRIDNFIVTLQRMLTPMRSGSHCFGVIEQRRLVSLYYAESKPWVRRHGSDQPRISWNHVSIATWTNWSRSKKATRTCYAVSSIFGSVGRQSLLMMSVIFGKRYSDREAGELKVAKSGALV